MHPNRSLKEAMFPYLEGYGFLVSASGIRYGSVAYIAFGKGVLKHHQGRASTIHYPVELEIGSDDWKLVGNDGSLIDSRLDNVDEMRNRLQNILIGRMVRDIEVVDSASRIVFDDNLILCSQILPEPASGFLYSFQVANGPVWETIDGVSMQE